MKVSKAKPYQNKLRAHKQTILRIYSPHGLDSNILYSISMGGELIAWDLVQQRIKHQHILSFPHLKQTDVSFKRICSADFSNLILYTGLFDGKVYSWSINTGELIDQFDSHKEQINIVKKINNRVLITGGKDGVVNLWDTISGNLDKSYVIKGSITDVHYKEPEICVISDRQKITTINLETSALVCRRQTGIGRYIIRMFDINGSVLLQMSDNMLECYNNINSECVWKTFIHGTWVNSIQPIQDYLMCGCEDSTLRMLSLQTHEVVDTVKGHNSSINSLQLAFGRLFSGGADTYLLEWEIEEFHNRLRERKMMRMEDLESAKYEVYMKLMAKKKKKKRKTSKSATKKPSKSLK